MKERERERERERVDGERRSLYKCTHKTHVNHKRNNKSSHREQLTKSNKRERKRKRRENRLPLHARYHLFSSLPRPSLRRRRRAPPFLRFAPLYALDVVFLLLGNASRVGAQKSNQMGNVFNKVPDASFQTRQSRDADGDVGAVSGGDGEVSSGTEVREVQAVPGEEEE